VSVMSDDGVRRRKAVAAGWVDILPGSRPTNPFGITYLRIPAGSAQVLINGKPTAIDAAAYAPQRFA